MSSHPTFGYLAGVIPSTVKRNTLLFTAASLELTEATVIVTHKNPYPTKIRIAVVDAAAMANGVPQTAPESFAYFNVFVGEGCTFETQTLYVADGQSILVWSDKPNTSFALQGAITTLPSAGSGLIASTTITKEERHQVLLSNVNADDQSTVSIFACNKGSDVARIRLGITDTGKDYPYIEADEYYDFNIKLNPGQTYVRTGVRVGGAKDLIIRSSSEEVNFVALGTLNFEAATQVSLALPGNLSVGGTSTFQGTSSFTDDVTISTTAVDYNRALLTGYNVGGSQTWSIDSSDGSAEFGDVDISGYTKVLGSFNVNDVFTVDPVTGDVNVAGALSAGTFNYEISIDGDLDLLNNRVINMAEPQAATDAATRRYVDNYAIIYAVALS